jgi:hypothetical protein
MQDARRDGVPRSPALVPHAHSGRAASRKAVGELVYVSARVGGIVTPPALLGVAAAGCAGTPSALAPVGPQALLVSQLWWLMFTVCAAVFVLVLAATVYATLHRRSPRASPDVEPGPEPMTTLIVQGAVALTALVLAGLILASIVTGRALSWLSAPDPSTIEGTAEPDDRLEAWLAAQRRP